MPIAVICPGCKTQFRVSDQFAGKSGNCPKCKGPIEVPNAAPEVKIHEAASAVPKDSKGRPVTAPILREAPALNAQRAAIIVVGCIVVIAGAWIARNRLKEDPETLRQLAAIGAVVVSLPVVVAGYHILREPETQPFRGRSLWIRAALCGLFYAGLWGLFSFVPGAWIAEYWAWFYIAPPFLLLGAAAAFACFDLEFGNGFFHYCLYLTVTIPLAYLLGLSPLAATTA